MSGLQWGLYNQAESVSGLQVGFINYAKYIDGLQIGVLNIAENGWFPAMILVNGAFKSTQHSNGRKNMRPFFFCAKKFCGGGRKKLQ